MTLSGEISARLRSEKAGDIGKAKPTELEKFKQDRVRRDCPLSSCHF
jgi:hypothetical protein